MIRLFIYFLFFVNNNNVNSYSRFFPRLFSQKKRFTTTVVYNDIIASQYYNIVDDNITSIYNNNTERIQKFIEYMKLKTFEDNEMEIWDSGEIEWEF